VENEGSLRIFTAHVLVRGLSTDKGSYHEIVEGTFLAQPCQKLAARCYYRRLLLQKKACLRLDVQHLHRVCKGKTALLNRAVPRSCNGLPHLQSDCQGTDCYRYLLASRISVHFKVTLRSVETDFIFHEEVHLPEQHRGLLRLYPGKDQANWLGWC
jgi:hypothetical protein